MLTTTHNNQRPALDSAAYQNWRAAIEERYGLYITPARQHLLENRLWTRLTALGYNSYADYYHYLVHNPAGRTEWPHLLDLLLNNETSFYRHPPSYQTLADYVLPHLLREKRAVAPVPTLHAWSVGCSRGPEAYTLALTLHDATDGRAHHLHVTGSDISRPSLEIARRGHYPAAALKNLPSAVVRRHFRPEGDGYTVAEHLRHTVTFNWINLAHPHTYPLGGQDIIFCQNVLIYFKPETRTAVIRELARRLNPGGYLFLAPAEALGLSMAGLQPVRLPDVQLYHRLPTPQEQ